MAKKKIWQQSCISFDNIIRCETPKNTQVQIFIKIGSVDQKLEEGG